MKTAQQISEMTGKERAEYAVTENFTLDMCERYNVDLQLLTKAIAKAKLKLRIESLRAGLEQVDHKLSLNDTMKEDHRNSLVYDKQELLDEKSRLESLMNDVLSEYQGVCQEE